MSLKNWNSRISKTLLETDIRAHLFRASTKAARPSGTLGSCGRKDENPVRRRTGRPRPPLPGSRVVRVRTDHARCEQGGEEMRHVVGPPEYAATQKSRLRQRQRQDASVTTKTSPPVSPCIYEGAPHGLSYFTAMLDHIFKSLFRVLGYFMQRAVYAGDNPVSQGTGTMPCPGRGHEIWVKSRPQGSLLVTVGFSLELTSKCQEVGPQFSEEPLGQHLTPLATRIQDVWDHTKFNKLVLFDAQYWPHAGHWWCIHKKPPLLSQTGLH